MTGPNVTIGMRLKRLAALRSQNAKQFAETTGIPYRTLQDYMADRRKPGAEHLAKLSENGCDVNWLLTGQFVNPSIMAKEYGFDIESDAVVADQDLLSKLMTMSQEITDAINDAWIKKYGHSLTLEQLLKHLSSLYGQAIIVAQGLEDQILILRKHGTRTNAIVEIIKSAILKRLGDIGSAAEAAGGSENTLAKQNNRKHDYDS